MICIYIYALYNVMKYNSNTINLKKKVRFIHQCVLNTVHYGNVIVFKLRVYQSQELTIHIHAL